MEKEDGAPKESWEDQLSFASLSLDKPKNQQEDSPQDGPGASGKEEDKGPKGPGHDMASGLADKALLAALMDSKERPTVLQMETEILDFLSDPSQDIFEFSVALSNYQRMLAHKVAQYYNLQTTTADHEGALIRVVAHRTGVRQRKQPPLSSLDLGPGTPETIVVKTAAPLLETPKLLKRVVRENPSNVPPPRTVTPKDRDEAYEKARARILTDGDNGYAASAGRTMGAGGRGFGPGPGRGRGRGGRDRGPEIHDPDYTRGPHRYGGIPGYEGMPMHGMAPAMMMVPPGASPMYAMHGAQQQEMAWGARGGSYTAGRQPPPPPPASTSSNSFSSKGGSRWPGAGGVMVQSAPGIAQATPSVSQSGGSTATTAVPPPPPPPPHTAARPYPIPGSMMAATPFQQGASAPMAMYPAGSMQPMHGMGPAMYAYPLPQGGAGYAMVSPEQAMAMAHGSPQMGHYPGAGYMGGMQPMGGQGYQAMYGSPMHGTAMGPNMAMPLSPGSPGMAMAYAPIHGMHGYAMPYGMQAHPTGMATMASAGSGGLYTGPGMQGQGVYMGGTGYHMGATNGAGGRGGGRGGYKPYGQHQQATTVHSSHPSAAPSGPNSASSLASKPGAQA